MTNRRLQFSRNMGIPVMIVFIALTAALAFAYKASQKENLPKTMAEVNPGKEPDDPNRDISKVTLNVRDMSCSGCIATIKESLSGIRGIEEVLVDIGNGKAEVYYDSKMLKDVAPIAAAMTASGYPAEVARTQSAEEIKKERGLAAAKSRYYIASVGGWDIARPDFDTELEIAKKRYVQLYGDGLFSSAQGTAFEDKLKIQIATRLVDEGFLLQEITKSDYTLSPKAVEEAFQTLLLENGKDKESFKASVKEAGYDFDYFMKRFENKVLIDRYLDDRILAGLSTPLERQNALNSWFQNSRVLAEVVYYDKDLEGLIQQGSAAGGCCPAN